MQRAQDVQRSDTLGMLRNVNFPVKQVGCDVTIKTSSNGASQATANRFDLSQSFNTYKEQEERPTPYSHNPTTVLEPSKRIASQTMIPL